MISQPPNVEKLSEREFFKYLKSLEKINSTYPPKKLYRSLLKLQRKGLLGELFGVGLDVGACWCRTVPVMRRLGIREVYVIDFNLEERKIAITNRIIDKDHYAPTDASDLSSIFGESIFDIVTAFLVPVKTKYVGSKKPIDPNELKKMFEPPNKKFRELWSLYVQDNPYIWERVYLHEFFSDKIITGPVSEWDTTIPEEMAKVLKPNGTILVSSHSKYELECFEKTLKKYGVGGKCWTIAKSGETCLYIGKKT